MLTLAVVLAEIPVRRSSILPVPFLSQYFCAAFRESIVFRLNGSGGLCKNRRRTPFPLSRLLSIPDVYVEPVRPVNAELAYVVPDKTEGECVVPDKSLILEAAYSLLDTGDCKKAVPGKLEIIGLA